MNGYYKQVTRLLKKAGFSYVRNGKGSQATLQYLIGMWFTNSTIVLCIGFVYCLILSLFCSLPW